MRAWVFLAVGLIVVARSEVWAQVPPGYEAASFARIGVGARALSLGGAFTAVAEDITAAYWNPAGLAYLTNFQVEGMYTNWFGVDIHLQYLGAGGYPPLGDSRPQLRFMNRPLVLAFNWFSSWIPNIPWSEDGTMGTFDAWSHLFVFSAALRWDESWGIGANVKVFHDRILEGWSLGISWDLGILLNTHIGSNLVRVAVVTTDIGSPAIQWYGLAGGAPAYLPWLFRIGASIRFLDEKLLLCGSLEWGVNVPGFKRAQIGAEAVVGPLALRLGWQQPLGMELATGPWCLGLGLYPFPWITLDYAFLPGRLGESHLLALRIAI